MSERRRIDTIKLDEKSLRRLSEKLKKLTTEESNHHVTETEVKPVERRKEKRPAKFQVYQPGITRLSNRNFSENFEKSAVKTSPSRTVKTGNLVNKDLKQGNEERRPSRGRGRGRPQHLPHQKLESGMDQGEGFLGRHRTRVLKGETNENFSQEEEHGSEDELAWDNYGGSALVHGEWSPQVTTTETGSHDGIELSDQEMYPELTDDERPHGSDHKVDDVTMEESEDDEPSVATSGSNKDFYKVTHSISSQSDHSMSEGYDEEDFTDEEMDDVDYTKPQLYDPTNPEQPIIVNRTPGRQRSFNKPLRPAQLSESNAYSPGASQARIMSKVMGTKPRRQRRHRNSSSEQSPPRRYDNRYPDDGFQEYESNSPRRYHYSENLSEDEDTVTSRSRSVRHQSRIVILNEAERYECTLSNLLASPSFDSEEYSESLSRVRNKVKILYEKLVVNDIEAATDENLDQKLWKNVYYQVIEILREQIRSCPEQDSSDLRDNLILLLDQGTAFYESLLENLQRKHHFNLKDILNSASARKRHHLNAKKRSLLSILTCQRVFICLGDIARYREQATHTNNYGRARHCYLQAQLLAPKNGRPYNQLAVLAVKTRHKLDAVYYYVRSLVASNPILSARESLMALFDEVRRKLDYVTHKQEDSLDKSMKRLKVKSPDNEVSSRSTDFEARKWEEVWILPGTDAERKHHNVKTTKPNVVEEIPELNFSSPEIVKHFILFFLNIHGKLFTRIGLDVFPGMLTKTLKLFAATTKNLKFMTTHRMLQLFTVNLFAVLNAEKQSIHGSAQDSKQNQCRALRLAFSMLAITVDRLNRMFASTSLDPFLSEEVAVFLPAVKIMFDWMYANMSVWYPPPEDLTEPDLNIWDNLAVLCNFVYNDSRFQPKIQIYEEMVEGLHEVFLAEDTQLAGFSPLGQAFSDPRYVENEVISSKNKLFLQQTVRISLVRDFLEYLCGMEEPLLAFKQGLYISVTLTRPHSWSNNSVADETLSSDFDIDEYSMQENDSFVSPAEAEESGELHELRKLRDRLQIKKDLQDRRDIQMKSSLESEERVKLEICPKYLVPDTNCFIDNLNLIQKLILCGKFKIATPLVVVNELEGLTLDKKDETSHAEQVQQNASKAVSFIKRCISENNPKFCVLTKKGTELKSLRFRSEETTSLGKNDDFILQSTHGYAKYHASKHNDSVINGERILHRNVVLLTDDRNLRLKALLMQDMATKSIKQFCDWVKLK